MQDFSVGSCSLLGAHLPPSHFLFLIHFILQNGSPLAHQSPSYSLYIYVYTYIISSLFSISLRTFCQLFLLELKTSTLVAGAIKLQVPRIY